jgi:hypothetical protein
MIATKYSNPEALLADYYGERGEQSPANEAMEWLRRYVRCDCQANQCSYEVAQDILARSVFDVEDLAQNFLGLDLLLDDLRSYDEQTQAQVFGVANPNKDEIVICFRAEAYRPLYRSTVMHEVAHILLDHRPPDQTLFYSPASHSRPREEMEADRFMARALLPKPILFLAVVYAASLGGLRSGEAFDQANSTRGRFQW